MNLRSLLGHLLKETIGRLNLWIQVHNLPEPVDITWIGASYDEEVKISIIRLSNGQEFLPVAQKIDTEKR